MENERKDAESGTPDIFAENLPAVPPFSASRREIIAAVAMYALAYCYFCPRPVWLGVFTLGFIALTELLHQQTRRSAESFVWLGCTLVILAGMLFDALSLSRALGFAQTERVWDDGYSLVFLHIFAVYWALSRSGRLCAGESGRLLPLDVLHGFLVFPFRHFFLRIRTLLFGLRRLWPRDRALKAAPLIGAALALLAALGLFGAAVNLLGRADDGFSALTARLAALLRFEWDPATALQLLFSLPVGAYLFGLLAGSAREDTARLHERGEAALRAVALLRRVPEGVWLAVLAAFSALYAVFFVLQGSYLFGAFTRTLPEGFIVSQYARQGFFELCKVLGVNFVLLWCVTRSSRRPVQERRALRGMCAALLAESLLFAVVAFSKLALYIDCFGFTPLRLQSSWLVCVLFFGCVCALVSLFSGRKTFRWWMIFGAVTLALLHLY